MLSIDCIEDSLEGYDELTEQHLKDQFGVEYFSCELQNMDSDFRWVKALRKAVEHEFNK